MKQKQTCACKQSPPPFSSLSEHSTRGNDSSLGGGVCSALPSVPRGLRKASTLMHDIIQPRSRRKRRRREGRTKVDELLRGECQEKLRRTRRLYFTRACNKDNTAPPPFRKQPKHTSAVCNSRCQYISVTP